MAALWTNLSRGCKFWYKNIVLSSTKDYSSFDPNAIDVVFENEELWGVKTEQEVRFSVKDYLEKKQKQKLDFSNLSHSEDISTAMVEKYSYEFLKKSIDDVWDIEEDIRRYKHEQKNKKNFEMLEGGQKGDDFSDEYHDQDISLLSDSDDPEELSDGLIERIDGKKISTNENLDFHAMHTDGKEKLDDEINKQHFDETRRAAFLKNIEDELVGYKSHNLPLADEKLVTLLKNKHIIFYNLLAKIQETHAPNDFVSAYQIQDRIAYLINNPTLLYKDLARKLITYLEKINQKLQTYHNEIAVKQQVLKSLNSQLAKFHEHKRKTEAGFANAEEEATMIKEEISNLESQKQDL